MKQPDIKLIVTEHFASNPTPASYQELIAILRLPRKHKPFLKKALEELSAAGKLVYVKRRYSPPLPKKQHRTERVPSAPMLSSELIEGVFDATPLSRNFSYAFVRTEQGDFFVGSEDTLNAYHNDKVAIEPHFRNGKADYGRVRRIVTRANERMAGDLSFSSGKAIFICSNPKIHNWFEITDTNGAKEGEKVILQVSNWGSPLAGKMPGGKVVEVLGPSGDPQVELIAVIRQYDLPLSFCDEVMEEVNTLPDSIDAREVARREDLRDIFTFTIDPASAKDFDDAISIRKDSNGYTLWVHIADVAHYVKPETRTFDEAVKRGNSFYFPKKVIPMLPERLSNLICSLRPDEDKLCMTVITHFDPKGRTTAQKMVESVIRSNHRLSYEQVDELFETGKSDFSKDLKDALSWSRELSALLSAKRVAAGYIFFDLPEIEYEYDQEGFVRRLNLAEETESHKLIENFMLVANEYTAEKLSQLSPTSIYRVHENPDPRKLERLGESLSYYGLEYIISEDVNKSLQYLLNSMPNADYHKVFDRMVLRSLKKAKYTPEHLRHFGLGMENYTHFTSPIRRLCDLVVHLLCKTYVIKSSKLKLERKQIALYAEIASSQELLADEAERDIDRTYSLAFMKKHLNERFHGMVIGTNSSSLIVRLTEIPITAVLKTAMLPGGPWAYQDRAMRFVNTKTNYYYQLMDKLIVDIVDVSDDIYLELANIDSAHTHAQVLSPQPQTKIPKTSPGRSSGPRGRNRIDVMPPSPKSGLHSGKKRGSRR